MISSRSLLLWLTSISIFWERAMSYNKKDVSPRCAIQIDLMKAFDSVEWSFIE
ncbi:hypothetical protein LINPERPRIM_LOCUS19144 [Linum perenne]